MGEHPVKWYGERVAPVPDHHDEKDRDAALSLSLEKDARFRIGVLYRAPPRAVFGSDFRAGVTDKPLAVIPFPTVEKTETRLLKYQPAA
jgi:2-oxoglutarate ferredoxin oxidoreductase subunit beta